MPERVHQRFDDAVPNPSSKKRKREHLDNPCEISDSTRNGNPQAIQTSNRTIKDKSTSRSGQKQLFTAPKIRPGSSNIARDSGPKSQPSPLKARAEALWRVRRSLPIWSHAAEIRQSLRDRDVLLLVGETGSGKSTQVPQLLLDEQWCKPQKIKPPNSKENDHVPGNGNVGGCIAITEPRRVAAITLARRVAEEMGSPLGSSSPASKVGYSVRFDNSTSPCTRIKFLTEGMLLQEMLRDPWLTAYSAVIVDEVHERGVNVDLVLGFLRQMVGGNLQGRAGVPLKVVVMSATAEMDRLKGFFEEEQGESGSVSDGQETFESNDNESEWSGISASDGGEGSANGQRPISNGNNDGNSKTEMIENGHETPELPANPPKKDISRVSTCHVEGRQYPVTVKYIPEPVQDIVDAALRTVFSIHRKEPMPGDILVFLTGQETVESLESLVKEYAEGLSPDVPKMLVLPLFAALPQAAQQRVFQPAPPKTRKIIISTNIAETSVTVSGVRFVIDSGKAKTKHFRSQIGLDSLLVKPISKSAAIQRKGRAGREAPGQCYRLYTEPDYHTMQESNTPEILRCDLSHALLTMKARGVTDVVNFPYLSQPPRSALEKALLQLYQLDALTPSGDITPLGQQMAKLPLNVSLGRVLLAASTPEFNCVSEAIDIIACLSVENIFLNLTSDEKKEAAETARRELFRREGDHLTLLATAQAYAAENSDRKAWAQRHFVSHRAMQAVMDVRKQLRQQFKHLLRLEPPPENPSIITPDLTTSLLKCFLKGFATNTARLCPDGSYKTLVGCQTVAIHPSSGLFGRKVEAVVYNEFVFTNRSYARGVSAVQMDWIGEALGV